MSCGAVGMRVWLWNKRREVSRNDDFFADDSSWLGSTMDAVVVYILFTFYFFFRV